MKKLSDRMEVLIGRIAILTWWVIVITLLIIGVLRWF